MCHYLSLCLGCVITSDRSGSYRYMAQIGQGFPSVTARFLRQAGLAGPSSSQARPQDSCDERKSLEGEQGRAEKGDEKEEPRNRVYLGMGQGDRMMEERACIWGRSCKISVALFSEILEWKRFGYWMNCWQQTLKYDYFKIWFPYREENLTLSL